MAETNGSATLNAEEWNDVNYLLEPFYNGKVESINGMQRQDSQGNTWKFMAFEYDDNPILTGARSSDNGDRLSYILTPSTQEIEFYRFPPATDEGEINKHIETVYDHGLEFAIDEELTPLRSLLFVIRQERLDFEAWAKSLN